MPYYFIRSFGIIDFFKNDFNILKNYLKRTLFHLSINVTFCIGVSELVLVYL